VEQFVERIGGRDGASEFIGTARMQFRRIDAAQPRVVIIVPEDSATRASNVSPSMVRVTVTGRGAAGLLPSRHGLSLSNERDGAWIRGRCGMKGRQ